MTATASSTSSSAGYWADDVDLWDLNKNTRSCPKASNMPATAAKIPPAQQGRRHLRGRHRQGRHQQHALDPGRRRHRPARHRLPRHRPRQRLRRQRVLRQPEWEGFHRDRQRDPTRRKIQERHERQLRRHLQHGADSPSMSAISLKLGELTQGNNLWVPKEGTSGNGIQYDNLADSLGVASAAGALRRAVRRSEQRGQPGHLPGQRLHLAGPARQLLVRFRQGGRRQQRH